MLWHVATQDKQMCSQQGKRYLAMSISLAPRSVNVPLTVSSVQMEWTCVPNITEVKMRKRRPSKHRRMRRMTVAGGEKELHSGERRDKEKDVEGKRRWRHEEALQCQYCPLLAARLHHAVSEVRAELCLLSLIPYQHLEGQELTKLIKACVYQFDDWKNYRSRTVRNEGGNWALRGLKNRLTRPVVFKTVQEMEDYHDQRMERDECNVHLKKNTKQSPISTWKLSFYDATLW